MDWEESPPPSRVELLDKGFSTTQSSAQFQNHFQHQHSRFITSSSSLTSIQNNYQQTNSSSNNSSSNGNNSSYRNNHQVINLSESGSKSGFSNHLLQHFSSSSTNTSPSGSSTSSSPPPLLSTSYESASSLNPPTTTSTPSPSFGLTNNHSTLSGLGSSLSPSSAKASTSSPTTTTSTNSTSSKRNKPIPPPLDLSIGAANLSLHSNDPDSSSPTPINLNSANPINGSCLTPNFFERPCYYLSSPKFNQAEKTLPLRKRYNFNFRMIFLFNNLAIEFLMQKALCSYFHFILFIRSVILACRHLALVAMANGVLIIIRCFIFFHWSFYPSCELNFIFS